MIQLEQLGFSPFFQAQCELMNQPALVPARVASDARDHLPIVGATAPWAHASGRLRLAIETGEAVHPAVGDWLLITDEGDDAVIHHVLDRRTSLKRRAAGSNVREQVIAANVDVFFIVTAIGRDFNPRRVERYLTAVWDSGASPVVVLNKIDLAECTEPLLSALGEVALAVPVVSVSAQTGDGVDSLRTHIGKGITAAFVGSSGVGKSTLVNRLIECEKQSTSPVGVTGKGKHTTSRRELIALPGGGVLIDTPGLREFGIIEMDGLDVTFADISELATGCHFTDCTHTEEPGCAVNAAVSAGALSPERLASYLRLRNEAAVMQARRNSSQANNSKKRWKSIHKGAKEFFKISTKYR